MKRSNRILIVGVIVEALIAGIGISLLVLMADGTLTPATGAADARATVFSVLGAAMGALGGLLAVLWIVAKRRES